MIFSTYYAFIEEHLQNSTLFHWNRVELDFLLIFVVGRCRAASSLVKKSNLQASSLQKILLLDAPWIMCYFILLLRMQNTPSSVRALEMVLPIPFQCFVFSISGQLLVTFVLIDTEPKTLGNPSAHLQRTFCVQFLSLWHSILHTVAVLAFLISVTSAR